MADDSGGLSAVESLLGDRYTREARLAPAFLSLFPILLLLMLSFHGLQSLIPALLSLLCVFGVVRWISHIARGIGDKKEIKLFRKWGGKPTTTMLRVAMGYLKIKETHLGDQVAHLLWEAPPGSEILYEIEQRKGVIPPTKEQDQGVAYPAAKAVVPAGDRAVAANAPAAAQADDPDTVSDALDHLYEPVVAWMRENSRDSVLVIEEEISYGFQRNFFALRYFALACVVVSLIVEARAAHLQGQLAWPIITHIDSDIAAAILAALVAYLICLLAFVTNNSVKVQGFIYARALLDSFYVTQPADHSSDHPAAKPADKTAHGKSS